jgi:hypothetical protein
MSGAWSTAAWLLTGFGLVIAGFVLPLPSNMATVSWVLIVIGGIALMLGATQLQMMIGSLLQRSDPAGPRKGVNKND